MPRIVFEPTGRRVDVEAGANLLEVCRQHGIPVESLCGGNGACGKCAVQIVDGDVPITEEERIQLGDDRLARGWRLACQTRVGGDLRVTVPVPPSALEGRIMTSGEAPAIELKPAVRKHLIKLEPAAPDEPTSDADRVLENVPGGNRLRFRPLALRALPEALRLGRGTVTATVWNDTILDVEPGDTSLSNYGIAFDVGTSTVAALLVDLNTGNDLGVAAGLNPQRRYGEDVISRIAFCRERADGTQTLAREIAGALSDLTAQLAARHGVELRHVGEYVAVGNTTMAHLVAGVDPSPLGELPYAPVFTAAQTMLDGPKGARLGHKPLEIPAALGGFVGSDVLSAVVALGLHTKPGKRLFLDIGTNAELVAGGPDRTLAASAAAGPAFEGAKIECGMIGSAGAVESCTVQDGDLAFGVIGDAAPAGICGSGLVDIVAVLLDLGVIDRGGRLVSRDESPQRIPPKVRERLHEANGMTRITLAAEGPGDVYLSQRDVRELQNAKAAIAAGVDILLSHLGISADELDEVLIAGAFGSTLNPRSAQRIGVIPNVAPNKLRALGNTALQGAKVYLLSTDFRAAVSAAADQIELRELSAEPDFIDRFAAHMPFGA